MKRTREQNIEVIKEVAYDKRYDYVIINKKKIWIDYESTDADFDICTDDELNEFIKKNVSLLYYE